MVWIALYGDPEKVARVARTVKTVSSLGEFMRGLGMRSSREYESFRITGINDSNGEKEIEIGIEYLRDPETMSPVSAFEQIAHFFGLPFVYRVEDREDELFINSDTTNTIYDDHFVVLGNCFGLEDTANCEYFADEASLIDWFRNTAGISVTSLDVCIRQAEAITNAKTGVWLSAVPYRSVWPDRCQTA